MPLWLNLDNHNEPPLRSLKPNWHALCIVLNVPPERSTLKRGGPAAPPGLAPVHLSPGTFSYTTVFASEAKQSIHWRDEWIAASLGQLPQFILSGWLASQSKGSSQRRFDTMAALRVAETKHLSE